MKKNIIEIQSIILLAKNDIRLRYRRSILGPNWIMLSFFITVIILSFIWTKVFKQQIGNFMWYFSIGYLSWNYIIANISASYNLMHANQDFIKNISISKNIFISRSIFKEIFVFLHCLPPLFIIGVINEINIGLLAALKSIIGFFLLTLMLHYLVYIMSMLCLRFTDLKEIFSNIFNLLFYVTPILWPIENLGNQKYIYLYNPFYHYVNVVRGPLINDNGWLNSIVIVLLSIIIFYAINYFVKKRYDVKSIFWL